MSKMNELLQEKNCSIRQSVSNWQEAIHVACQPLIEQGYCNEEYVDAVFENTEQYGPYYFLCEHLALIHASNKKGVFGTQMAVTLLKEPIKFKPDGYDVRVLVTLVAKDSDSHMEGIQAVSAIFSDPEQVQSILNAADGKEIYEIFVSAANSCKHDTL